MSVKVVQHQFVIALTLAASSRLRSINVSLYSRPCLLARKVQSKRHLNRSPGKQTVATSRTHDYSVHTRCVFRDIRRRRSWVLQSAGPVILTTHGNQCSSSGQAMHAV